MDDIKNTDQDFQTQKRFIDYVTMPGMRDRKKSGRFQPGDILLDRYKVLAELGQGGMGVVYRCLDKTAGVEVALKALPPELSHNTVEMEDVRENYILVSKLVHQNIAIVKNLEKDEYNGNYYLIMECCEGEDLRRWIKRKRQQKALTLDDVLPIVRQVANAIDYAHEMKVMHRDIKTGNIMINSAGEIKLLDFGLAAQIHSSMSRVSVAYRGASGTGPYMAPEQWRGRAQGAPSDQYALAVMTYEMLAGHLPFENAEISVLREAVLNDKPERISGLPKYASDAIERAMRKDPRERFDCCADFVAALEGRKIKDVLRKKFPGNVIGVVAACLCVLLTAAGGAGYYFYNKDLKTGAAKAEPEPPVKTTAAAKAEPEPPVKTTAAAKAEPEPPVKTTAAAKAELEPPVKTTAAAKAEPEPPVKTTVVDKSELERKAKKAAVDKAKREKYIKKLSRENNALLSKLKKQKAKIDSAQYDRGQTFGSYLDSFAAHSATAELALKNGEHEKANRFLISATQAGNWLTANAPLRAQTHELLKSVPEQKAQADRFNGAVLASAVYRKAEEAAANAKKDYEAGKFKTARALSHSAISCYNKAYFQARRATIDHLLKTAREAAKNKQWELMKKNAAAVLKIDGKNPAALQLLKTKPASPPTLEIIATVNGKRVPAQVKLRGKTYNTTNIISGLSEGKACKGELSHQAGNVKFTGKLDVICLWQGVNRITVPLKAVIDFDWSSVCVPFELFAEHPEYFIMNQKGWRLARGSERCYSNPDVQKLVMEHCRKVLRQYPDSVLVLTSSNRIEDFCICPACRKMGTVNGSFSVKNLFHAFAGFIQKRVKTMSPLTRVQVICRVNDSPSPNVPQQTATSAQTKHRGKTSAKRFDVSKNKKFVLPQGIKLDMVHVKAGSFMMGSPPNELGRSRHEEMHKVTLTQDFWIGKFEVTQAQWRAVMGNNPSKYQYDDHPVEQVSWDDAKMFCTKLNEYLAGKLPAKYQFDLPTEAQWEYACRAGTTTALNNGKNLTAGRRGCVNLNMVAWYRDNTYAAGHKKVGSKLPNAWGIYDMHGNILEWCRDTYESYGGNSVDPVGNSWSLRRMCRGGSWKHRANACRSALRTAGLATKGYCHLGFRLALVPVQ